MEELRTRETRGAKSTAAAKRKFLAEIYGDEDVVEFDEATGKAKINGETIYLTSPTRRLSMRHELVADLAATGMKPTDIGRQLSASGTPQANNHYGQLLRDPRIRARSQGQVISVLEEAQEKLKSSVVTAATNIHNAVLSGDVGVSKYVLATQGIIEKKDNPKANTTNVNMDFGSWLSSVSNTKDMHEIPQHTTPPPNEIDITNDVRQLPPPTEGERL